MEITSYSEAFSWGNVNGNLSLAEAYLRHNKTLSIYYLSSFKVINKFSVLKPILFFTGIVL